MERTDAKRQVTGVGEQMSEVFCGDCLNTCDEWEYEFGYPDCVARQQTSLVSKWDKTLTMGEWLASRKQMDNNVDIMSRITPYVPVSDTKDVANDSE